MPSTQLQEQETRDRIDALVTQLAELPVRKYVRMLKAGNMPASIVSILTIDLAMVGKTDGSTGALLERFIEQLRALFVGERDAVDGELIQALGELRASKYERVAVKDLPRVIDQDAINGDGAELTRFVPTRIDLPTLAIHSPELDSIVNDDAGEGDTSVTTHGNKRALEMRQEVLEERRRLVQQQLELQIAEAAAEAPLTEEVRRQSAAAVASAQRDLSELDDVAEPPVARMATFSLGASDGDCETEQKCARVLLDERMYLLDDLLDRARADELWPKVCVHRRRTRHQQQGAEHSARCGA